VHLDAAAGQRQRDPAGPDAELQRPPASPASSSATVSVKAGSNMPSAESS